MYNKMYYCKINSILAYSALIYILASIIYLAETRKYGTPFKDALSAYPNLLKIKKDSVNKRRAAFTNGLLISMIVLFVFRPLNISC